VEHRLANSLTRFQAELLKSPTFRKRKNAIGVQGEENHRRLGDDRSQALLSVRKNRSGFRLGSQRLVSFTCGVQSIALLAPV
jgi:hypothetical protein